MLLAACHKVLVFTTAARSTSVWFHILSQSCSTPINLQCIHSKHSLSPREGRAISCLINSHCWNNKGLTLVALQKGDDRAKADSESQPCYLCGCPVRFPWLQSEPARLWDVHQRYLHAEAGNMSSCGSTKQNGIFFFILAENLETSQVPILEDQVVIFTPSITTLKHSTYLNFLNGFPLFLGWRGNKFFGVA